MTENILWEDENVPDHHPPPAVTPPAKPAASDNGITWLDEEHAPDITGPGGYLGAAVAGAARNVPYATDMAATLNAAKTYVGMHPTGVPTTGSFGERRAAAKQTLQHAQQELGEQYPGTTLAGQVAGAVAMPSVLSGVKAAPAAKALLMGAEGAGYGALAGSEQGGWQGALTGATLGGVTGGAFGALAPRPASKSMTDVVEAGERAGVPVPYMAASDSVLPRLAGAGAEVSPLGGYVMNKRAETALETLGDQATKLAGPTRPTSAVGEAARDSLADWVQHGSSKEAEKLYAAVDKHIDPRAMTHADQARMAIGDIVARRQAARLPTDSASMKLLQDAVTHPEGLTYAGMKDLRTRLGGMLKNPTIIPGDVDRAEIKTLYEALSKDLRSAASNAGGPQALAAFDRANSRYSQIVGQRNQLAKIIGKEGNLAGETVYSRLTGMATTGSKADVRRLELARRTMGPGEWQEVTSGVISNLGQTKNGFSPAIFNTGFAKLSDTGKNALFGPRGSHLRDSLEDIGTLSRAFEKSTQFKNRSRSATTAGWGASAVGLFADPMTTIGANLGAGAVGAVLSHPMTARSLANLQRLKLAAAQGGTGAARLAVQAGVKAFVQSAKDHAGVDVPPNILWDDEQPKQRASGGRVDRHDYPAKKLSKIERAALRARGGIADELVPVMELPDDVVADALALAK